MALPLLLIGFWLPANAASILYGVENSANSLLTIDTSSGASTTVGGIGFTSVRSLAYDAISDTMYAVENTTDQLLTIDLNTGAGTVVGAVGFGNVQGLTFASSGTLYGTDTSTNQLITIDTSSGTGTAVSANQLGFSAVGGLAFDTFSGTLFGVDFLTDQLISIDTGTGIGNAVGSSLDPTGSLGSLDVVGLAYDASLGLFGADTGSDRLITINSLTGAATVVGSLGVTSINGLSFAQQVVPIPAAAWLFGSALGLLGWMKRRASR